MLPRHIFAQRFAATRSGPRAFMTDRQRRRMLREETSLEQLLEREKNKPLKNPNKNTDSNNSGKTSSKQNKNKNKSKGDQDSSSVSSSSSPSSSSSFAVKVSDSLNQDPGTFTVRGRKKYIEHTMDTMRERLSGTVAGGVSVGVTEKDAKLRDSNSLVIKKDDSTSSLMEDHFQEEEEGEGDYSSSSGGVFHNDLSLQDIVSRKTSRGNRGEIKTRKPLKMSIAAEQRRNSNKKTQKLGDEIQKETRQQEEEKEEVEEEKRKQQKIQLQQQDDSSSSSSAAEFYQQHFGGGGVAVINDIDSSKLEEIELARSGALAKRVRRQQLPLPVFADETDDAFFSSQNTNPNSRKSKNKREFGDDDDHEELEIQSYEEAAKAIKRIRGEKLTKQSYDFIAEKDGNDIAQADTEVFRQNAHQAKEQLGGTEAGEFVATEVKGDELKELKQLARKAQQLADEQQQQQQQQHEQVETNSSSSSSTSRSKTELLGQAVTRVRVPAHEIISKQHSPSTRFDSELAATATVVPTRRFSPDELAATSDVVQHRSDIAETQEELYDDEKQTMSPLDASVDVTFEKRVRQALMKYYARYPINGMIRVANVIIGGIQDDKGKVHKFDEIDRPHLTLAQARRVAHEHGKDLIQVLTLESENHHPALLKAGHPPGGLGVCYIADHLGYAMDDVEHQFHMKNERVTPAPLRPLLDIGFRGSTHDFAIRFKTIYVAKFLYKKFPVRLILTRFGTFREGFPIFERILGFVRAECERMKNANFVAGQIRYDSSSIWCYLHPSTVKMPLTSTDAPSPSTLKESYERAVFDTEYDREVTIPDSFSRHAPQEKNKYLKSLDEGTAWAHRSEGLSLASQRRQKLMQHFIPKGNNELYARRGDVNMKAPFGSHHQTGTDPMSFPRESNIEQAERAAGVLTSRAKMSVTEVLDKNELPSQTHTLGKMSYMMWGDVLEAGDMKEKMGLKRNRKKIPKFAPGFATLGQAEDDGIGGGVTRF